VEAFQEKRRELWPVLAPDTKEAAERALGAAQSMEEIEAAHARLVSAEQMRGVSPASGAALSLLKREQWNVFQCARPLIHGARAWAKSARSILAEEEKAFFATFGLSVASTGLSERIAAFERELATVETQIANYSRSSLPPVLSPVARLLPRQTVPELVSTGADITTVHPHLRRIKADTKASPATMATTADPDEEQAV
jgi:hypothetical protein